MYNLLRLLIRFAPLFLSISSPAQVQQLSQLVSGHRQIYHCGPKGTRPEFRLKRSYWRTK